MVRRLVRLETAQQATDAGPRTFVVHLGETVTVNGEQMTRDEYQRRYSDIIPTLVVRWIGDDDEPAL